MGDSLNNYPLEYEEEAKKRPLARRKTKPKKKVTSPLVRKVIEMAKQAKASKYAPTRLEVAKTVTIAVLVTSVVAFVAGMQFQQGQEAEVRGAIEAATKTVQAEPAKK